eukprot:2105835-Rhodomonas_salina.1
MPAAPVGAAAPPPPLPLHTSISTQLIRCGGRGTDLGRGTRASATPGSNIPRFSTAGNTRFFSTARTVLCFSTAGTIRYFSTTGNIRYVSTAHAVPGA